MGRLAGQLWVQVALATLAGIGLGLAWPGLGVALKPLGDLFVQLVRMLIAPVIFCTVVHGVAGLNDLRRTGRVALKALVYFEAVTLAALLLAVAAVDLWRPGRGMHLDLASLDAAAVSGLAGQAPPHGIVEFIRHVVPESFAGALTGGDPLQVLFVAVLFALGLGLAGEHGRPVHDLVGALAQIFFRIVGLVMRAAPLGAFGSLAFTTGRFGAGSLVPLAGLIAEFTLVSFLFVTVVLGGIARLAGFSLLRLVGFIRDEIVIVAATTSTETVLPRIMEKLRRLGCAESVVGLVVPAGYAFNLDGTCLYLATVSLFLAQATDVPLDASQQAVLLGVLLVSSKGAAGVAGAALVVLASTLAALGTVPVESVALILGIHRLLAEALTFVNLVGNCVATIVVAAWEGELDRTALDARVGR